jgi:hypothetical protein
MRRRVLVCGDGDHITMINAAKIEHTIMKAPTIFQVPSS